MKILIRVVLGAFLCFCLLGNKGCESEEESILDTTVALTKTSYPDEDILPNIEDGGEYRLDNSGYTGTINIVEGTDAKQRKFILHLEGTHYEMGYQHGYLLAPVLKDAVARSTVEMVQYYLGNLAAFVPINTINQSLRNFATNMVNYIPLEYLYEILGMVDGAAEYGAIPNTEEDKWNFFLDIVILNVGPDIASAIAGNNLLNPWIYPLIYGKPRVPGANYDTSEETDVETCDGFVVTGNRATTNGATIMGRNFMYSDDPYWKYGLIIEYHPVGEIPHVGVGMAGIVGIISGMNSEGLGIGVNLATSLDSAKPLVRGDYELIGMGAGIASRKALAESADLEDAIDFIKGTQLGAPWVFMIADGIRPANLPEREKNAAALTKTANSAPTVRYITDNDPKYLDEYYVKRENEPDILVTSNFSLMPSHYDVPVLVHGWSRYSKVLSNLIAAINDGGVCFDSNDSGCQGKEQEHRWGTNLVNYLRTWSDNPMNEKAGEDKYEKNYTVRETLATSVTLFDLTNTRMKTLYSKYSHNWVERDFF